MLYELALPNTAGDSEHVASVYVAGRVAGPGDVAMVEFGHPGRDLGVGVWTTLRGLEILRDKLNVVLVSADA